MTASATTHPPPPFTGAQRRGWAVALALTLLRLALTPLCVLAIDAVSSGAIVAVALVVGFVSDVMDGVVARRAQASTAFLRRLDSTVDTIFYLGVAYAAWRLHPAVVRAYAWPIAAVLVGEAVNYLVPLVRFGQAPAYHARSAKLFGLLLFVALVALFARGWSTYLPVALAAGLVAIAESIAMSCVLPGPRHDVPGLLDALRIRAGSRTHPDCLTGEV